MIGVRAKWYSLFGVLGVPFCLPSFLQHVVLFFRGIDTGGASGKSLVNLMLRALINSKDYIGKAM